MVSLEGVQPMGGAAQKGVWPGGSGPEGDGSPTMTMITTRT